MVFLKLYSKYLILLFQLKYYQRIFNEVKGRFMIFFKSLIFLPFRLCGYLICHSLCSSNEFKIPYIGVSLAQIVNCDCTGMVGGSSSLRSVKSLKLVKSSKKSNSKVITLFKRENSFDKKLDKQLGNLVGLLITHNSAADQIICRS